MIAAVARIADPPLRIDRPAELSPPDDERLVEESTGGEVVKQRRCRPVGVAALSADRVGEAAMMIPPHVKQLHEAHAALREAPGEEAVVGIAPGALDVGPVGLEHVLRLVADPDEIGHARLHPEGHLILARPGGDVGIADAISAAAIERRDPVERCPARLPGDPRRIGKIQNRGTAIAEPHPLMLRRQKPRPPQPVVKGLVVRAATAEACEDEIGGEIGVLAPQAVARPGADARPACQLAAGLEEGDRRIVVDRLGVHRTDHAPLIGLRSDPRNQIAEPHPAFAMLGEGEDRRRHREARLAAGHRRQPLPLTDRFGQLLPTPRGQRRLGIEEIHLRGRA